MRMIGPAILASRCAECWRADRRGPITCRPSRATTPAASSPTSWPPSPTSSCSRSSTARATARWQNSSRRKPLRRLHLVRLPLGAVWRGRAAAERALLRRPIRLLNSWRAQHDATAFFISTRGNRPCCGRCSALAASAIEMPTRKAGLWEMKMVRTGSPTAGHDHAALHRRDHRQGDEQYLLADVEGCLLQKRHPEDRDRLHHRFGLHRRRHLGDVAFGNHRRFQFRLCRQGHLAQPGRPVRPTRHHHDGGGQSGSAPARPTRSPATS